MCVSVLHLFCKQVPYLQSTQRFTLYLSYKPWPSQVNQYACAAWGEALCRCVGRALGAKNVFL